MYFESRTNWIILNFELVLNQYDLLQQEQILLMQGTPIVTLKKSHSFLCEERPGRKGAQQRFNICSLYTIQIKEKIWHNLKTWTVTLLGPLLTIETFFRFTGLQGFGYASTEQM